MKSTLYIALCVAFIDNMGVGLIYPLFSSMLFDSSLASSTGSTHRKGCGAYGSAF